MTDLAIRPRPAARLRLRFPGEWREIPLVDPAQTRDGVRRLVLESIGRADDRARLRAEVRGQLLAAAEIAREAGADRFVIALEAVAGIPIPTMLTLYSPSVNVDAAVSAAAGDVMGVVLAALDEADGDAADPDAASGDSADDASDRATPSDATTAAPTRFSVGASEVIVRSRVDAGVPAPNAEDEAPTPNLIVDFWMTVPQTKSVVLLSFSTSAVDLAEPLTTLYRAVVSTATWRTE